MPEPQARQDELQPLTPVQVEQWRAYADRLWNTRIKRFEAIPEGWERTWEMKITPELVIMYADGVEDYNTWYEAFKTYGTGPLGVGESPFGPAIAPPLLVSENCSTFFETQEYRGRVHGAIASREDTEIFAPVPIGTVLRYRGRVVKKFLRRGRQYLRSVITAEDAATGQLFIRETRETLCKYAKAE
ncbi:MAG: hypothetical protein HY668_01680 [Chloroflexi bacterium]|nr:hypothetical protein [Chloroflexota bacterium]